jgi:hypothetical protein
MGAGLRCRVCPLAIALLVVSSLASAQDPPSPTEDQVAAHARKHAVGRLVKALKGKLQQLRVPVEEADRLVEKCGVADELPGLLRDRERDGERLQAFDDGACEARLTVRLDQLAAWLRELAARKGFALENGVRGALDGMAGSSEPFLTAAGVGIPRAVAWARQGVAPDAAWEAASAKVRTQTDKSAGETALRDLWKAAEGLSAGDELYVGAFLRSRPGLREMLEQTAGSRIERSPPRLLPGGVCEVDVFLDLADLAEGIENAAASRCPPDSPWRKVNLERLVRSNGDRRILWATGKALLPSTGIGIAANALPEWYLIELTGEGVSPIPDQAESEEAAYGSAELQAWASAFWDLWQKILALKHPSGKTLAEMAGPQGGGEQDPKSRWSVLHGRMYQFAVRKKPLRDRGEVRVEVQIPLERVWELVKDWE